MTGVPPSEAPFAADASVLFLGADGGGTGCRVRIRNSGGELIGEAQGGSANAFTDFSGAMANLLDAAERALAAGGLASGDLARCHAGLGLAGADIPDVVARFQETELPFVSAKLRSDVVTACIGAHSGADGALAVLGTGTAYIVRAKGRQSIFGGWGFAVSDRGSGADLGRRCLAAALLAHDGLGPVSPLTEDVLGEFEGDPARIARFAAKAPPGEYGRFARILFERFDAGDPVAGSIVLDGIGLVEPALRRLLALGAPSIVLVGGLAPRYRTLIAPDLVRRLTEPDRDALEGALMLARGEVQ